MKIVVVFGATGAQGSSVVSALLAEKYRSEYAVVGITRNPDSVKAVAMKNKFEGHPNWRGFRVADADKPETLTAALDAGTYAAYIVTNYWEHLDGAREERQARAMMDACRLAGVTHVIFSGLPSPQAVAGIKGVDHFEYKHKAEEYLFSNACIDLPIRTSVQLAFYYENLLSWFLPRHDHESGDFILALPMANQALFAVSVEDCGVLVAAALDAHSAVNLQRIFCAGSHLTGNQMAAVMSKETGLRVRYEDIPIDEYRKQNEWPGANDMAAMFEWYQHAKTMDGLENMKRIYPHPMTFEQWIHKHGKGLVAMLKGEA